MFSNDERYMAGKQKLLAFLDQNSIAYEETEQAAPPHCVSFAPALRGSGVPIPAKARCGVRHSKEMKME